ncbi:MAG TPA: neuraminidase-like domain-containing protein, partial [Ktedonobacteraceae bacterium]|nr:neuraminidase-like domain-containing protein [Ktedonobacteraceae bacterium]
LVACLLAEAPPVVYLQANAQSPISPSRWLDPNDVFAWSLIDVEMSSCQATSRIVQATAAVQLFVQRCFLNLESEVTVDAKVDQDWLQWQWMSQYRVWQANREVFLFPENWIDPTLRSNKSSFFTDLEQELKQSDLTNDAAETALSNYLEKLEAVARLDVCGAFHDMENDHDVLYVLARTQGSPPIYYIRQWVDAATWTAWEKVDLDIASDHLLPIVWNGKLYLFWAIVTPKPDQKNQPMPLPQLSSNSSDKPDSPNMHLEVQLAWSQYKQGKWQAKQTAPQVLTFQGENISSDVTLKSSFTNSLLEIDIFLNTLTFSAPRGFPTGGPRRILTRTREHKHVAAFLLGGTGSGVEAFMADTSGLGNVGPQTADIGQLDESLLKPSLALPTNSLFDGDWIAPDLSTQKYLSPSRWRTGTMYTTYDLYGSLNSELVLARADNYRLIVPHQTPTFDSSLPFFYRDSAREYFCVPTLYYQSENYFTVNAPAYVYHPFFRAEYRFWPFYHAFVPLFIGQLNMGGIPALYSRDLQLHPTSFTGQEEFDFASYYQPTNLVLDLSDGKYPLEGVDFESDAGYALYNWELFFHAPFLIAESLTQNQRFDEAKQWYEYIFNPTSATTDPIPQRYWITAPFFQTSTQEYANAQLAKLMKDINTHDPVAEHNVAEWRKDPFDPDMIAQQRPVAYQRAIVMKYIDNLIQWGDQLFKQDTMETLNQATQLYVLASALLGPRPQIVQPRVQPSVKTYADLEGNLDDFSNELVAAENVFPPVRVNIPTRQNRAKLPNLQTLYFRIPSNETLFSYWDTIDDRLFKIRHCMNIQGVVQHLPLFAPPISPGLLIAAATAGLDLGSVLSDSNAAVPPYRFIRMFRQALEMCEQVRGLGDELLQALEKRDAENLACIRSGSESQIQAAIADVRSRQIDEASQQIDALNKGKQAAIDRSNFYTNRALTNVWEAAALVAQAVALVPQSIAGFQDLAAASMYFLPTIQFGTSGVGGTPHVTYIYSGSDVAGSVLAQAGASQLAAAILQSGAQMSTVLGQYKQRQDEWNLQATLASDEMMRFDSEILAAQIRQDIATRELNVQQMAVTQATNVDAFLHSKYTNQELYDWMIGEISTTYFQAYQLAYSLGRQAEQCFRRELAITDTNYYIQFGYWDSLRKGLTAAEKLQYDLRRLEAAYYTQNVRELELTKHVSLAQIDPYALVELRSSGTCLISLPELLFDLDNPGHYVRRLKTVGVTVPCIVGPYSSVSLTLALLDNHIRVSTGTSGGYPGSNYDVGFINDPGGTSEIVTSSAQNDNGLFELRFEDERYLPFEGAGAISNWRLTLNNVYPQFDYSTIRDVVLHIRYTARDGGSTFASVVGEAVKAQLNLVALAESRKGLYRMFSARQDYGTAWARFLSPGTDNDQILSMPTPPERFPFFTYGLDLKVVSIDVLVQTSDTDDYTLVITSPGGVATTVTLSADQTLGGLHHWANPNVSPRVDLGKTPSDGTPPPLWSFALKKASATDFRSLSASDVDDLILIVGYQVS